MVDRFQFLSSLCVMDFLVMLLLLQVLCFIDQCFFEESINQRLLIGKTGNKQQVSNQQSVRSQYLQKMMDNKVKGSRRGLVRAATRVLRVEVME